MPIHAVDVVLDVADVDVDADVPDTGAAAAGGENRLFNVPFCHRINPPIANPPRRMRGT